MTNITTKESIMLVEICFWGLLLILSAWFNVSLIASGEEAFFIDSQETALELANKNWFDYTVVPIVDVGKYIFRMLTFQYNPEFPYPIKILLGIMTWGTLIVIIDWIRGD